MEETKAQRLETSKTHSSSSSSSSIVFPSKEEVKRDTFSSISTLPSFQSLIILCLATRILFAIIITTSFTPDEYYQGVEEAYRVAYKDTPEGASIQPTWEWTNKYRIRSYALILPYIAWFSLGRFLGIDTTAFVWLGPRLLQAVMAAIGDVCLYKVSERLGGELFAVFVLLTHLNSWSALYMMSRTIANSTEAVLLLIGLYIWY